MIYYERLEDGRIGRFTTDFQIAQSNRLTLATEEEMVSYDGRYYLQSEYNELIETDEYKAKKAKEERERLDGLSMTRGDVFEALILAKGIGKTQIRTMIEQAELDDTTKLLYLNRFDEALEFYRGYPIFNLLGEKLGITGEMLDEFFETKDYKKLTAPEEEESEETEKTEETENGNLPADNTQNSDPEDE